MSIQITDADIKKIREIHPHGIMTVRNSLRLILVMTEKYNKIIEVEKQAEFGPIKQKVTVIDEKKLEADLDAAGFKP